MSWPVLLPRLSSRSLSLSPRSLRSLERERERFSLSAILCAREIWDSSSRFFFFSALFFSFFSFFRRFFSFFLAFLSFLAFFLSSSSSSSSSSSLFSPSLDEESASSSAEESSEISSRPSDPYIVHNGGKNSRFK